MAAAWTSSRWARHGWIVAAAAVGVAAAATTPIGTEPGEATRGLTRFDFSILDVAYAQQYADALWGGRWSDVYSAKWNQLGPLQLAVTGALAAAARATYPDGWLVLRALMVTVFAASAGLLALWLWRHVGNKSPLTRAVLPYAAIAAVAVFSLPQGMYTWGHWMQPATIGLWIAAGVAASRGSPLLAGCAVGLSVAMEPWGVFGALAFLQAAKVRHMVAAAAAAAAVSAAVWLPFLTRPQFAMGNIAWGVRPDSLWGLAGFTDFGWQWRFVQAAAVAAVIGAAMLWLRRYATTPAGHVWLATLTPALIVTVRAAADTMYYPYYLFTAAGIIIVSAVTAAAAADYRGAVWLSVAALLTGVADINWAAGACRVREDWCSLPAITDGWWLSPHLFAAVAAAAVAAAAVNVLRAARPADT